MRTSPIVGLHHLQLPVDLMVESSSKVRFLAFIPHTHSCLSWRKIRENDFATVNYGYVLESDYVDDLRRSHELYRGQNTLFANPRQLHSANHFRVIATLPKDTGLDERHRTTDEAARSEPVYYTVLFEGTIADVLVRNAAKSLVAERKGLQNHVRVIHENRLYTCAFQDFHKPGYWSSWVILYEVEMSITSQLGGPDWRDSPSVHCSQTTENVPATGTVIESSKTNYVVVNLLGEGGFGAVYK
ncbi:hypothetical protein KIN20_012691 [Parelaphostrongylus tenuis]|uniref:Uncharacterized protein n=1 Tax=Parelaphostrongylus tenuis TaxID=148309 RepID=A0AAD5QMZ2_PARTN|nr:hypothetical protein KIN20_012691 [Parelaphostrongylus tenuis]